ncbi:class I SAM-dependent methyltransferase [Solwaraspora sp. WMMD406]|uniref:class I SAM-dependent methyltransferase n=1 Tax=Solwaraspora sp. WMMD406 TaxID=3016095 RepID=UPI002417F833|nr:class I SAM-dependent methyltransferase [Solwaraspora sp. WMMD406]MDG4766362.1 class I SAM-dependent methyltransferase [Solwaraspora sp. WMMD406]
MPRPALHLAARVVNWPLTVLIRPYPRLNALVWDLQYALGLWRYLDTSPDSGPLDLVRRHVPYPRILDLGCGTTANLALPPGRYRHYHGVDISRAAIRRARSLRRPDATFEVADVLRYRGTETYDAILFREVLYYFPPDQAVGLLLRAAGMLRPGGRILIWVYDTSSPTSQELVARIRDCGLVVHEESIDSVARRPAMTVVLGVPGPSPAGFAS